MEAVREEFINWLHSHENNRAPGRTCLQGVANLEKGVHWTKSGIGRSKGCGSAMRAAPIGYLYQHDPEKLKEVAHATGICTHGHPTADAACIGAAYLVKLALDGTKPQNMIPELLRFTSGISGEFDEAILKVKRCIEDPGFAESPVPRFADSPIPSVLGEGWIGEEAVALALYCFLRYPDDYKGAVLRGANSNGDSDSIASIAGSISGAYLGIGAIPPEWIMRIERTDYLRSLAERLAEKKERLGRGNR
jgi:ADP-ribosylglycohydrolase